MKKLLVLIILALLLTLVACKEEVVGENIDLESENALLSTEINKLSNEEGDAFEEFNKMYNLDSKEEVYIRLIEKNKHLVGFLDEYGYMVNKRYYIYNNITKESIEIEGQTEYISEVWIEDGTILFYSDGKNIINGFKNYPNISTVNMQTGAIDNKPIYRNIGKDYIPYYMGNFLNETKLEKIEVSESSIKYDFGISENSVIAGGQFCPNLSVISNSDNSIIVDVENLIYNEELLINLDKKNLIEEVKTNSYVDGSGKYHSTFNFKLSNINEYTCDFTLGDDDVMNLIIMFK